MAYSVELRKKVMEYLSAGHTQREASGVFHISLNTVNKWSQRYQKTGKLADEKPYRTFRKLDPEKLEAYMEAHSDAYLKEIGVVFGCTDMRVHKALKRLKIPRKKRR